MALLFPGCGQESKKPLYTLSVSENGVGPLGRSTPYDTDAIAALLPGFDVLPFTAFLDGKSSHVLRVRYHGEDWLLITPRPDGETIASISVLSPETETHPFAAIGTPYAQLYTENPSVLCNNNGMKRTELICKAPAADHITYLFVSDTSGNAPVLAEVIWNP